MAVRGIHHISMKCASPEALAPVKEFYCGLLGLKVIRESSALVPAKGGSPLTSDSEEMVFFCT